MLVVSSDPQGKINVEVIAPVIGIARGYGGQGASKAICQQDQDFHENDRNEHRCRKEVPPPGNYRERHDAARE